MHGGRREPRCARAYASFASAQRQAVVTITNESSRRADELKRSTKDAQALKRSLGDLEADVEKQLARVLSMAQLETYKRGEASADYDRFR